jgi:hypothetical protein
VLPVNSSDVTLAYYRAAERYGYGDADQSYSSDDDQDYGSDDDNSYGEQSYGGENCE